MRECSGFESAALGIIKVNGDALPMSVFEAQNYAMFFNITKKRI
jgi:hypothetical protein